MRRSVNKKNGPHKTPTKILELRGSWRAKTRPQEPQAPALPPSARAPAWLDAEARKHWKRLVGLLAACGILTTVDEVALARYCAMLARWIKMEQFLQKHGEVSQEGALFPQVSMYLRLSDQLLKMEHSFGLTPSSRAHLVKHPVATVPPHGNSAAHDKTRFFFPTA